MASSLNNSSSGIDENLISLGMPPLERAIKFYLLLFIQIPSLICTIFIFYHFKWSRLQSQIYGFVLIVNTLIIAVELPLTLYFLHEGTVYSESICSGWITLNYSLFQLSIFLMVWTSIERYLFIYHERFILRHMILFHYGPITILSLYCSVLYVGIVVLHTCQPAYNVYLYICGGPCYSTEPFLGMFDWIGNGVIMQFGILVINIILILRHVIQRYRMKQSVITAARRQQWQRSVKLCIQLIGIALLYVIGWIPYSIIVLIQMFQYSERLAYILSTIFAYFPYLQALLLPYACILFIPEIKDKFFALLFTLFQVIRGRGNRVQNTRVHPSRMGTLTISYQK